MKKWMLRISMLSVGLIFIGLIAIYALIASERGSQWLINTAIDKSGHQIEVSGISGNLLSSLTIKHFSYLSCNLKVSLESLQLDWVPHRLFDKKLAIQALIADTITVNINNDCQIVSQKNFILPESLPIPFALELDQLNIHRFNLHQEDIISVENILLNAHTHDNRITLQLENLDYTTLNLQTKITAALHQPYAIKGKTQWRYLHKKTPYQGQLSVEGDINHLDINHRLQAPYTIETTLTANNLINNLNVTSISQWDNITASIDGQQKVALRNGTLKTAGTISEIQYEVETLVDTSQASNISFSGKGIATTQSVSLRPLKIQHEKTQLSATGHIEYSESIAVFLDVIGKDINPALIHADYPGQLQLDTKISYTKKNQRQQFQLDIIKLHGQLHEYPVKGSGQIKSDLAAVKLNHIHLSIGDNKIEANGIIAKSIDLHAKINASNVEQIFTRSKGELHGTINILGTREHPVVDAKLSSRELQYQDNITMRNIELSAHSEENPTPTIDALLTFEQINLQDQSLHDLRLNLTGTLQKHLITSNVKTEFGLLSVDAQGAFEQEKKQWQGTIEKLLIEETPLGSWENKSAIHISASPTKQSIETLCMQQLSQSICANYKNDINQNINAQFNNIELKILQSYFNDYGSIQGLANGTVDLIAEHQSALRGTISVNTHQLTLIPKEESDIEENLFFEKMQLEVDLKEDSNVQLLFTSNYGDGLAQLEIHSLQNINDAHINQGSVQFNLPNLLFLNPHINEAVIKKGQASFDMNLSGPLQTPQIKGQGKVEKLHFYIPELGTEYKDVELNIDATTFNKMNLDANLNTEDGNLDVTGWVSLEDIKNVQYQLSIIGDNFPVLDTLDVSANITPNLSINGNTQKIKINGSLLIPKLHIISKKLPAEIDAVSNDEIIISESGNAEVQDNIAMLGNIDLTLGKNIIFTGYGLQTDLSGGLKITLQEHQSAVGHGVLFMENAQYNKFGQVLDINKGNIIFSGPLEDPSLDIQIQRNTNDVTVDMFITGKAENPQTRLTSNPSLSEANKLSYLLTGRGINDLSDSEGGNLTNAALALGLSQSSATIQEIGNKFGLDTLSVGAGENGLQSTSLLLGKHLSPKLYITYAKDLFSALGAIQMNYRLTDHISLEVESGTGQTVDLIYSISKE